MTVARVASQATGAIGDAVTAIACAYPVNVTSGNLLVIMGAKFVTASDAFVAGDVTKTAGTATIGTVTLDSQVNYDGGSGGAAYIASGVWSVPVTGTGSCTMQVGGAAAGSYMLIAINEYTGADVSGTRVEGQNTGTGTTGAPATGNATVTTGGVFLGSLATYTTSATTHTVGADYTQIFESENGSLHMTGSFEDRIVSSTTTDAADWTAPTTAQWCACVVTYKQAAAAGTRPVKMAGRWGGYAGYSGGFAGD